MFQETDYSKMLTSKLLSEKTKYKQCQILFVVICVLLVGSVLVNIFLKRSSGAFSVFAIFGMMFLVYKSGSELKKIQDELNARNDQQKN